METRKEDLEMAIRLIQGMIVYHESTVLDDDLIEIEGVTVRNGFHEANRHALRTALMCLKDEYQRISS